MEKVLRLLPRKRCEIYQLRDGSFVSKLYDGLVGKVPTIYLEEIDTILISTGLCGWDSVEIISSNSPDLSAFIFSQKRALPPESFVWMPASIIGQTISQVWTKREALDSAINRLGLSRWLPVLLEPQALRARNYPVLIKDSEMCWCYDSSTELPHVTDTDSESNLDLVGLKLSSDSMVISSLMNGHILDKPVSRNNAYRFIGIAAVVGLMLGFYFSGEEDQVKDPSFDLQSQQKAINWIDENILISENLAMSNSGTFDFSSGKARLNLDPLAVPRSQMGVYSEKDHSLSFSLPEGK